MKTSKEVYALLNVIRYSEGDVNKALKVILKHPTIRKKMTWEAAKFSSRNAELSKEDLMNDAATVLYSSIISEWSRDKDPEKAVSWCCSRIGWRIATHVAKEVGLERRTDIEGKGVYSRPERTSLTDEIASGIEAPKNAGASFALMADLIRDANIEAKYKHPLVYVLILGCNFKELARWYGCTAPTASNIYKKSLSAFKEYVEKSDSIESEAIFETIKEILEG